MPFLKYELSSFNISVGFALGVLVVVHLHKYDSSVTSPVFAIKNRGYQHLLTFHLMKMCEEQRAQIWDGMGFVWEDSAPYRLNQFPSVRVLLLWFVPKTAPDGKMFKVWT